MGQLRIDANPSVLAALRRLAPADGEVWVTMEKVAFDAPVGLGAAAVNLKGLERQGLAEKRVEDGGQPEYRAAPGEGEAGTLWDPSRSKGDRLG